MKGMPSGSPPLPETGPKKRGRKSRWEKLVEDAIEAKKSKPVEPEEEPVAVTPPQEQPRKINVFEYPNIFWKLARPKVCLSQRLPC